MKVRTVDNPEKTGQGISCALVKLCACCANHLPRLFLLFLMLCFSCERKEPEMLTTYLWPEVFTKADYEYPDILEAKAMAIADGLSGWAICMSGGEIPKLFGQGMVKIGSKLGILATEENFRRLADEFLSRAG